MSVLLSPLREGAAVALNAAGADHWDAGGT